MRVGLVLGDIARLSFRVGSIVTSSNRLKCGNQNSSYWRFAGRENVDGAVRKAGGDDFVFPNDNPLNPGEAIASPAVGTLLSFTDAVIHTHVPDGEFGSDTSLHEGRALLSSCYLNSFRCSASLGHKSVALPALGCGVRGWKQPVGAAVAIDAVSQFAALPPAERGELVEIVFVFISADLRRVFEAVAMKNFKQPWRKMKPMWWTL